jgi:propionyl-CoA carboxylase alpha chain
LNGRQVVFDRQRHVRIDADWVPLDVTEALDKAAKANGWRAGEALIHADTRRGLVTVQVKPVTNGYRLEWRGMSVEAHVFTPREAELARRMIDRPPPDTSKVLLCPMPGLVVSLAVVEGQSVKAGDTLAIVEAMKMQNVLRAERDGVVKKINAKAGDSLGVDAVIMEFS